MLGELLSHSPGMELEPLPDVLTIAIEGPVCAGKSTLLRGLSTLDTTLVIPEYLEYKQIHGQPDTNFPAKSYREAKDNFSYFLEIEKLRQLQHLTSEAKIKYLDRSVYTLLAFELGVYYSSGIDIFTWAINEVGDSRNIIVPDKVVYLDVSKEVSLKRAKSAGMGTPGFMFSDEFNYGFKSFFIALNSIVPDYVSFIDANRNQSALVEEYKKVVSTWRPNL